MNPKIQDYYAGTDFGSNPKFSGATRKPFILLKPFAKKNSGPPETDLFVEAFANSMFRAPAGADFCPFLGSA